MTTLSISNLEYPRLKELFPIGRSKMSVDDFTYQVDMVYAGLGIPTLYGVLSILANKSVFFIGERGSGVLVFILALQKREML